MRDTIERRRRQLFGRRKGPKLSQHRASLFQTLLPQFSLVPEAGKDPRNYFAPMRVEDVWLEVGFGGGEHLLWQALHHPNVGLIGAEPYEAGVAKLLSKLAPSACGGGDEPHGLRVAQPEDKRSEPEWGHERVDVPPPRPSAGPPPQAGEEKLCKIRIYQGDARDIVEALPERSLGRVFVLFPDPWPKTRHHKRRFIQTDMLDALARVMKPGAELRFASDDSHYVAWTLERLFAHPAFAWMAARAEDWKYRPDGWPSTRYEEKALHGPATFLAFRRR